MEHRSFVLQLCFLVFAIVEVIYCLNKGKMLKKLQCSENGLEKTSEQRPGEISSTVIKTSLPSYIGGFGEGRLGNQMSAFATLYALGRLHGCRIFLAPYQKKLLAAYFRSEFLCNITDQSASFLKHRWIRPFKDYDYSNKTVWDIYKYEKYIKIGMYPNSINLYKLYTKELRTIFSPLQNHKESAEKRLQDIKNFHVKHFNRPNNDSITFIGIHVRRSDFEEHLTDWYGKKFVDRGYFMRAIDYYRDQFQNLLFFVVSDDPLWCTENIIPLGEDIYLASQTSTDFNEIYPESAGIDMFTLSLANHTILTYGTFGQWGAFFSGGQSVWPKSHIGTKESKEIIKAEIPGWTFV